MSGSCRTVALASPTVTWHPWRYLRERLPHVEVRWERLADGLLGETRSPTSVVLATDQLQRERRSTLTHEIGHVRRGPKPQCPRLGRREERLIDDWAARMLIPLDVLADALLWTLDEAELAEDLWVSEHMVCVRLAGLRDKEKTYIERRIAAKEEGA